MSPFIRLSRVERVQCRALSSCCHRSLETLEDSEGRREEVHTGSCLSYLSTEPWWHLVCSAWVRRSRFGQAQKEEGILGVSIQVSGCWGGGPFGVLFSGFQVAWVSHVPCGAEEPSSACCRHAE